MRERNTETSLRRATTTLGPKPQRRPRGFVGALVDLVALVGLCCSGLAHAQAPDIAPTARMLTLVSGGAPLRLTVDRELGQERLGPVFGSVLFGYVLPGGCLQHGFGVSASWNATHDGGYTTPVYAFDQVAVMPAYLAYYQLNPDVFSFGHIGVPVLVRGGPSAGLQVGAALAYRVFAGTGVFAGVDLNSHLARGFNLFASLELGVVIDYEVLP